MPFLWSNSNLLNLSTLHFNYDFLLFSLPKCNPVWRSALCDIHNFRIPGTNCVFRHERYISSNPVVSWAAADRWWIQTKIHSPLPIALPRRPTIIQTLTGSDLITTQDIGPNLVSVFPVSPEIDVNSRPKQRQLYLQIKTFFVMSGTLCRVQVTLGHYRPLSVVYINCLSTRFTLCTNTSSPGHVFLLMTFSRVYVNYEVQDLTLFPLGRRQSGLIRLSMT